MLHYDYAIKDTPKNDNGEEFPSFLEVISGFDKALNVLMTMCAYANRRGRCWPSMRTIAKHIGTKRTNKATEAREWLEKHQAIVQVPLDKRIGKEPRNKNKNVYQLTGYFVSDQGVIYNYVRMNDNDWDEISDALANLNVKSLEEVREELIERAKWLEQQKQTDVQKKAQANKNREIAESLKKYREDQEASLVDDTDEENYISTIDSEMLPNGTDGRNVTTVRSDNGTDGRIYNGTDGRNRRYINKDNIISNFDGSATDSEFQSSEVDSSRLDDEINQDYGIKKISRLSTRPDKMEESNDDSAAVTPVQDMEYEFSDAVNNSRLIAESAVISQDQLSEYADVSKSQLDHEMINAITYVWKSVVHTPAVVKNISQMLLGTIPKNKGKWYEMQLRWPSNPREVYGFNAWWEKYHRADYGGTEPLPVTAEDISVAFSKYRSWAEDWFKKRTLTKKRVLSDYKPNDEYSDWDYN